jgi:kumamolisin
MSDPVTPVDGKIPVPGSFKAPPPDLASAVPAPPEATTQVTVVLRAKAVDLAAPPMTREEYAKVHGSNTDDEKAVQAFAAAHHLDVKETNSAEHTVILAGTVKDMETAFGTKLKTADSPKLGTFRMREGHVFVPAELYGVITAVLGLDDRKVADPHFRKRNAGMMQGHAPGWQVPQICDLYSFPKVSGPMRRGAIISLGGGWKDADIKAAFARMNPPLPPPNITVVSVDGGGNNPGDPADVENVLDIVCMGAVIAKCTGVAAEIVVYCCQNTDSGFYNGFSKMIHDDINKPDAGSCSWGSARENSTAQSKAQYGALFKAAAAVSFSIEAAMGDNGSSDGIEDGLNHVDYPGSDPYVTGVGGTRLVVVNGQPVDTVWGGSSDGGATGGGYSPEPKPSWQLGVSGSLRECPDWALVGDPASGIEIVVDGQVMVIGGTSASAPLGTGFTVVMCIAAGKGVGFLNPLIYSAPADCFRDVTQGTNGAFSARPGPDPCSGRGVPVGDKFMAYVLGTPTNGGPVTPPTNGGPVTPSPSVDQAKLRAILDGVLLHVLGESRTTPLGRMLIAALKNVVDGEIAALWDELHAQGIV